MTTHEPISGRHHPEWHPQPARCIRCGKGWHVGPLDGCIGSTIAGHDDDRLTLAQIDQALADVRAQAAGQTGDRLSHYAAHMAALLELRDDAVAS